MDTYTVSHVCTHYQEYGVNSVLKQHLYGKYVTGMSILELVTL